MANAEIYSLDQSCDDLKKLAELLNIDSSLFRSFLEDSQVEEGDDEVLRAMIESLEPEIMNQDSCSETCCSDSISSEECRFSEVDQLECCSPRRLLHHQDFEWIHDMEMDYSCPGYELTGYFISGDMVEGGGWEDYSQVCYGMAMEEDDYIGLWQ